MTITTQKVLIVKTYSMRLLVVSFILSLIACDKSKPDTLQPVQATPPSSLTLQPKPLTRFSPKANDSINDIEYDKQKVSTDTSSSKHLTTHHTILRVLDISESDNDGKNGIRVTFSSPLDSAVDFQSYLAIDNVHSGRVEGVWTLSKTKKHLWFMNIEPKSQYQITVNPGIRAHNKTVLRQPQSASIHTRQLTPSINFDSQGMILPTGYDTGLPIISVNINAVDVDFFLVRDDLAAQFLLKADSYRHSYWAVSELKAYGDLVYSGRFDLTVPKNTRTKRHLDIHKINQLKKSGLYFAVMRQAGDYDTSSFSWFSVSDIGLHVRHYNDQLDIHAASIRTGKPLAHVDIELFDRKDTSKPIKKNRTTREGLASFTAKAAKASIVIAKSNGHYTLLNLTQPALDLSEFNLASRPQLPGELFIYSPRDLYRPAQKVIFSGLLRDGDGKLNHAAVLSASIINPQGSVIKTFQWKGNDVSYYEYQWTIPSDAPTGKWFLSVKGPLKKPVTYTFNVEEFLPERMKLTFSDEKKRTELNSANTPADISVLGEYLYGAPANGNRFSSVLYTSVWRSPIESLKDYQFGNINENNFQARTNLADIHLDSQGIGQLNIEPHWKNTHSPLKVLVSASLYESGGRPITRSHPILVWPKKELIGIRPHDKKANPIANSMANFDVVNVNIKGDLLAADDLHVTLIKEDKQYFWERNDQRGWHWNWSEKEYPVAEKMLTIKAGKIASVGFHVEWGNYRLEIKNTSTGALSSLRFFAGYNWYYDWNNAQHASGARPDKISLALDKPTYNAHDIAHLKITPPSPGEALILVEADTVLWSQKIHLPKEGLTVDIPISDQWQQHNIYVSAISLQPSGDQQAITPRRSIGLLHLPLNREERKLHMSLIAPDKIQPNSTLMTRVKLHNHVTTGQTTQSFVTLAAVDVGVLNISRFKTPDPFRYFFDPRRYDVDVKDMYGNIIEVSESAAAKQRFGGDSDISRGGEKPQNDVNIVSLFSGIVEFNSQGIAQIPLDIPDFNGRLRLMAVGFNDDSFGHSEHEVTVASPIVTEVSMPRFLAMGDKSMLALDIHNMTTQDEQLDVLIQLKGAAVLRQDANIELTSTDISIEPVSTTPTHKTPEPKVKDLHTPPAPTPEPSREKRQTMALQPQEKSTLLFPIEAIDYDGKAQIMVTLNSRANGKFTRQWTLGVRPAYPAITHSKQAVLRPGESFTLNNNDAPNTLASTLQASLSVSSVVNLHSDEQLKHLLSYPYGCLEQTSSKGYPLTFATPEKQIQFGMIAIDESTRQDMMQKGIERIISLQKNNGSFGLWNKDSQEEHWLSVYATDYLLKAKEAGMDVPQKPLKKAIKRLSYYLNSQGTFVSQRWSNDPLHYAFSTRAYAAYVLATINQAPLGTLRTLYSRRFTDAKNGLSKTHLGLALSLMGDKKTSQEALSAAVSDQSLTHLADDYPYLGDYGSKIRDIGMMIYLLLTHTQHAAQQQDHAYPLSLKLRNALIARHSLSTQERTALFLSGIALQHDANQSWQASWKLGPSTAQNNTLKRTRHWQKLFDANQLKQGFTLTSNHDKPLYIRASIGGYGAHAVPASNHGLSIERHWYTSEGQLMTPSNLSQVKVGDLLVIHLAISSHTRVPDALVINLLPAGFEVENQNLMHNVNLNTLSLTHKNSDMGNIQQHQKNTDIKTLEYRDDRVVAAINHSPARPSHVFFRVRAVTPGEYHVPPATVEDMYRPEIRGSGHTIPKIRIVNP